MGNVIFFICGGAFGVLLLWLIVLDALKRADPAKAMHSAANPDIGWSWRSE